MSVGCECFSSVTVRLQRRMASHSRSQIRSTAPCSATDRSHGRSGGPCGDPDLLERRPVVRRALAAEQLAPVGALERDVHLQPAVVRRVRVVPGALVAVDAHPGRAERRSLPALPACGRRAGARGSAPRGDTRGRVTRCNRAGGRAPAHAHEPLQRQVVPLVAVDLLEEQRVGRIDGLRRWPSAAGLARDRERGRGQRNEDQTQRRSRSKFRRKEVTPCMCGATRAHRADCAAVVRASLPCRAPPRCFSTA